MFPQNNLKIGNSLWMFTCARQIQCFLFLFVNTRTAALKIQIKDKLNIGDAFAPV